MSFLEHSEGLGRGNDGERSPSSASASKFSSDSREAASAVFQMTTQVAQFRRAVDQIGSKGDTAESRAKLHRQRERITQLAKDAGEAVKRISAEVQAGEVGEQGKAQHAKLVKDFQAVLKDFQRAQKACAERERMYSPGQGQEGRGEVELEERESPEQEDFRSLLAKKKEGEARDLEAEHEYNSALIEERERGISDIQAQIGEVNDIFKDLATLVSDQGAMVDDIEANISRAHTHARGAQREVTRADKSQRSSRRRALLCALFAALMVTAVVGSIVASLT